MHNNYNPCPQYNSPKMPQQPSATTTAPPTTDLQLLLQQFNKLDKKKLGNIKLQEALTLLRQWTHIETFPEDLLSRVIFNVENFVTFDQFLAMLYEVQWEVGDRGDGSDGSDRRDRRERREGSERREGREREVVNFKMIEFLGLLEEYRRRCEEASKYIDAEKAHHKIMEIRDKEIARQKRKMLQQQKNKVISVGQIQQSKLIEFNNAWNAYMDKYEDSALEELDKLKAKHLKEMEIEEDRIRNYYESCLKPSKKVIDLRVREKMLVKRKLYLEAEKLKNYVDKLEEKEREERQRQMHERIIKRKQTLQKHQQAALLAQLKKLQKDRTQQVRRRQLDSQKMFRRLRSLQSQIIQKQSIQIQQTLINLRQTMYKTSGRMFKPNSKRIRSSSKFIHSLEKQKERQKERYMKSLEKQKNIEKQILRDRDRPAYMLSKLYERDNEKRRQSLKSRVNSFQGVGKVDYRF